MGTIADKLSLLQQTKADIKAAIIEKGQSVADADPFSSYPQKIRAIEGGGSTAVGPVQKVQVVAKDKIQIGDAIYTCAELGNFDKYIRTAAFSPDGKVLVLGGQFTGYAKVYSVSGTAVTFVSNIYADAGTTALNNTVNSTAFSPDGKVLVLGGQFTGYAKVYSVSGTAVTFASNIYANSGTTFLSNVVSSTAFAPDGKTLVLGGSFSGYAKVYSVSGTMVTFVNNIYADAGTAALSRAVLTAAFSPDGKMLVLGGQFTSYAKVYSVSGTTVTFISNIYANSGTAALNSNGHSAAFSSDGKMLVLGGQFTGFAKVYSVSGTTVTFISNIYANSGTMALSNVVYSAAFSPDGKTLVLGGNFSGFAKVYSVSGMTVTFVPQGTDAYQIKNFIAPRLFPDLAVGYATEALEIGETGEVAIMARIE